MRYDPYMGRWRQTVKYGLIAFEILFTSSRKRATSELQRLKSTDVFLAVPYPACVCVCSHFAITVPFVFLLPNGNGLHFAETL